jgi:hypothetical protein
MKKLMLTLVALALTSTALVGCKASAEVDDDVRTNIAAPR